MKNLCHYCHGSLDGVPGAEIVPAQDGLAHKFCHLMNVALSDLQKAIEGLQLMARSADAAGHALRMLNNRLWDLKEAGEKNL